MMETRSNFRIACLRDDVSNVERAAKRMKEASGQFQVEIRREPDTDSTCFVDVLGVEVQDVDGMPIDRFLEAMLNDEVIEWKMCRVGGTFVLCDDDEEEDDNDLYVSAYCDEKPHEYQPSWDVWDKVQLPLPYYTPKSWKYYA